MAKTMLQRFPEAFCPAPSRAIFASHDPVAIGAMRAAFVMGLRIPNDVAIVGFADMDCADHLRVPLTTVWQPKEELGRATARLALRILNKGDGAGDTRFIQARVLSCDNLRSVTTWGPLPSEAVVKTGQSPLSLEATNNETYRRIHSD